MRITNRDLELLQGATLELHEPRDLASLQEVVPPIFERVIHSEYFFRLEFGPGPPGLPSNLVATWEHPARLSPGLIGKGMSLAPDHPFTEHVLRTGDLGPMRLSDFWTRRQQLASPIHQLVYRPLGIGRMLAIPIVRGGRTGAINLCRPFSEPDFSERDRELLRLLAPHFVLAVGAAENASAQRTAEAEALSGLGLTSRERDVATWLARGRTNPEIATILETRPRTVEKHVERILFKLDVENRTAAARAILGLAAVGALAAAPSEGRAREVLRRILRPVRRGGRVRRDEPA